MPLQEYSSIPPIKLYLMTGYLDDLELEGFILQLNPLP